MKSSSDGFSSRTGANGSESFLDAPFSFICQTLKFETTLTLLLSDSSVASSLKVNRGVLGVRCVWQRKESDDARLCRRMPFGVLMASAKRRALRRRRRR